jgi:hypothetical protein
MKTCFIQSADLDFFSGLNLINHDDFIGLAGEIVSNPGKRPVLRIILSNEQASRTFYLKKTPSFPVASLFKRIRKGVGLHGDAYIEQVQIERYVQADIPVMRIAAWGEDRRFGWPRADFLLAVGVEGVRLDRFIKTCTETEIEKIFFRYGELIGQMHQNGISEIVRVQDIICANDNGIELTIIDREHGLPKSKKLSDHERINGLARTYLKNLSALDATTPMLPELQFLLKGYVSRRAESAISLQILEDQAKVEVRHLIHSKKKLNKQRWLLSCPDF